MSLLKHSTNASEEERSFLQHRVGMFGLLAGGCFLFFLFFRVLIIATVGELGLIRDDPSIWYHMASSFSFISIWAICRVGDHSALFVRVTESAGLIAGAAALVVMGFYMPLYDRPEYTLLLGLSSALTARALYVPSSARRTLALSLIVGLELVVAVYLIYLVIDPSQWKALAPDVASMTADEIAVSLAVYTSGWWMLTVFVTTAASRVIYGLRRDVRDARQLGQYRLEHKIGEGGMGTVYRASHALLSRPTAVKLLRPDRAGPANLRRFEKEVQHTARLSHPNIITIYDYGHTPDGVFYYAMEYLAGMTLDHLVDKHGPQPVGRVHLLLQQIGRALIHAHGDGLIHRDIKPANIMLFLPHRHGGQHEQLKLLDFGLVRELKNTGGIKLTSADTISGTPQYMSPESILSPESVDGRSDLYAVGAVAYHLLTGRNVFEGDSVIEVCGHHLHTEPAPLSDHVPHPIPEALEQLIMNCLAKDPEQRPSSALAFVKTLERIPNSETWNVDTALQWWQKHSSEDARDANDKNAIGLLTIDIQKPS